MLRITGHPAANEYVLKLEGVLAGAWVRELDACWREISHALHNPRFRVDLTDVCHVDRAGRALMTRMYCEGVRFDAAGFTMPDLVRQISEAVEGRRS